MSAFKDAVDADIMNVFLNMEEFAEEHILNGVTLPAVVEGLTAKGALTKPQHTPEFEGVSGQTVILHIKVADLPESITSGNAVELDGEIYRVGDITNDLGVLTITLEVDTV